MATDDVVRPGASPWDLSGSRAVVTGGNRGIGAAIALELARGGADVISIHRSEAEQPVAAAVRELGRQYASIHADLSVTAEIPALVAGILRDYGPIDILMHNAGVVPRGPAATYPESDWDLVMNLHLKAAFLLAQGFGRPMLERGAGKIIFMASVLAFQGGFTTPAYAAAKAGVANLARALANEWAGRGVNVNAVAPGYIVTDINKELLANPVRLEQIGVRIPAGRWGTPEDIAPTVRFLASPAARYIHGQTIAVDGGWLGR